VEHAGTFCRDSLVAADPLLPLRIGSHELGAVRLASIVVFCALAGFLTPMLVDSWSLGDPRQAGTAYAVNVLGPLLALSWPGSGCCLGWVSVGPPSY